MTEKAFNINTKIFDKSISIITPCLNPNLIELNKLYKSIITQTFLPLEWVIIDGGSNINTINMIKKFKINSPIFINLLLREGSGIYSSLNIGIRKSKSDFYLVAGCDDILDKDCIYNYTKNLSPNKDFLVHRIKCDVTNDVQKK